MISYVTVDHNYTSTLTGKNETYTAIENYTATVTSTPLAASTATRTSLVTLAGVPNNTIFVIETTTVTTTVTKNVTRGHLLQGPLREDSNSFQA